MRSSVRHRVPFFETDAMGVVHHSNYVRYFELARVVWLEEHDQPYTAYVEQGLHFATTRVEVDYQISVRFDDQIEITAWLAWVRHASLCIRYTIQRGETRVAWGASEHAAVSAETGRARRVPRERRDALRRLAVETAP